MQSINCKVEDTENNKKYYLIDKYKQILTCSNFDKYKDKCISINIKKIIDDPSLLNKTNDDILKEIIESSDIYCNSSNNEPLKDINIGNYKIANTTNNEEISHVFGLSYILNDPSLTKDQKLDKIKQLYDFLQKNVNEEDLSKTNIKYNRFNFNNFDFKILLDYNTLLDFNNNNNNVILARGIIIFFVIIILLALKKYFSQKLPG
jgi:hypothetical protein